jgi:hypothetical protein
VRLTREKPLWHLPQAFESDVEWCPPVEHRYFLTPLFHILYTASAPIYVYADTILLILLISIHFVKYSLYGKIFHIKFVDRNAI